MNIGKCMRGAVLIILGVSSVNVQAKARTTFIPASETFNLTRELAMNNYWWYHQAKEQETDSCLPFSFIISPFYSKSRNGCDLAPYFLPDDKTQASFQQNGLGDVNPLWLQLAANANYDSKVSIAPQRKAVGGYFNLNFDFSRWCENVWLRINFAAMRVSHDLNLVESPSLSALNNADVSNIRMVADALNNPDWLAGKWSVCSQNRSGIDDVQLKLGKDWFSDCRRMSVYFVGGIPTGQRPNAKYLFEPLVGSRHGSVGFGLDGEHQIWENESFNFTFMGDFRYRYAFKGTECRSFDICPNGQLSRYLLLTTNQISNLLTGDSTTPGINTFTGSAQVTPRSTIDLWLALHGQYCDWNLEVGYNLWWRQAEKVCFCQGLPNNKAISNFGSVGQGDTASTANISQTPFIGINPVIVDPVFTSLAQASFIDVDSAAHPAVTTNKLYAAISRNHTICDREVLCGFAGSYEFVGHRDHADRALEQISFWFNLGINF